VDRRGLEREQPCAAGVPVRLVEGEQVPLPGLGGAGREVQRQVRHGEAAAGCGQGLLLDLRPRDGEVLHHRLHEPVEPGRPGLRLVGGGEHELAHEVVDVGLRLEQEVGRHVAELDGEPLGGLRAVLPFAQHAREVERRRVAVRGRDAVGGDLGPDDLPAALDLLDAPLAGQRGDQRQATTGHRLTRVADAHRRARAEVDHLHPGALRVLHDPHGDGGPPVQDGVGHQLGDHQLRITRDGRGGVAEGGDGELARLRDGVTIQPERQLVHRRVQGPSPAAARDARGSRRHLASSIPHCRGF
jgi:hypothetical protein